MEDSFYTNMVPLTAPLKGGDNVAEIEKHNDESMMMLLKHSDRQLTNDSNLEIVSEKSDLNYSITLDHGGMTDMEYYQKIVGDSYLYGRGSKREAEAVTCCSWVITLPKEVSDYSTVGKDEIIRLHPDEEKQFFQGALDFVAKRYGEENIVHAKVHYDEGGQPHIHIYFVPRKELDHDQVHFKTTTIKKAVQTESGRWEYTFRYKTDENGERIALKNYSKMSDYYDYKLAASEIINPVELKHFHPDFAEYLRENNLPGATSVHTGVTGGKNISVGAMKEFTRATGLTLDQVHEMQHEKIVLEERITALESSLKNASVSISNKDRTITHLQGQIAERDLSLEQSKSVATDRAEMEVKLRSKEQELMTMKQEYNKVCNQLQTVQSQLAERSVDQTELSARDKEIEALRRELSSVKRELRDVQQTKDAELAAKDKEIEQLRNEKTVQQTETREWGTNSGWGQNRGWGNVERGTNTWNMDQNS